MAGFNAFLKSNNIVTGTQIPTEGNYKTGDIVVNIGPNSADEPMWICNEGGNPGVWGPVGVGGGSGSIVSINSSVMIDEPVNEVSLESLGVIVTNKDKLLVHYNSVHLLEGVHFEIAGEGTKIVKLGEGSWNEEGLEDCMFAFELFKGVESIDGNEITVASKMTCKTNHVIIENPCGEVEIGIEGFKSENDTLMVFKNGVIMVEGVDYTIEGDIITSTGEVWNENGIEDYGMTFVVFKEVVEYNGDASNIDLSEKQDKTDESLLTEDKTVIGAINELFQSANNGKELIASAIGEPLDASDTFGAMSDKINVMKSDLKQVLIDEGVSVTNEDNMASLISKVDEEFDRQVVPAGTAVASDVISGKTFINSTGQVITGSATLSNLGGKRYAEVEFAFTDLVNIKYYDSASGAITVPGIKITSIDFKPSFIIVYAMQQPYMGMNYATYSSISEYVHFMSLSNSITWFTADIDYSRGKGYTDVNVAANDISIPIYSNNGGTLTKPSGSSYKFKLVAFE